MKIPMTVIHMHIDCKTKGIKSQLFLFCSAELLTEKSSFGKSFPE